MNPDHPTEDELQLAAHPHDAFFKQIFRHPEQATAFFKSRLPPALVAAIDWSTLKLIPSSFVKQDLQQLHADLLYSVQWLGRELLLYLIFEHQSTSPPEMPLRLMGYELTRLQDHVKEHGLPLPPILSFVLHQGPDPWTTPLSLVELFDLSAEHAALLQPYLPQLRYQVLDLSQYNPATQEQDAKLRLILQAMKAVREKQLESFLEELAQLHNILTLLPDWMIQLMLLYAIHADQALDVETIAHKLRHQPQLQSKAMTLGARLIQQGREEAMQEAQSLGARLIQQGREEAMQEAKTLGAKLIQQGREEGARLGEVKGRVMGESHGKWMGRLQLLQEMMELPVTADEELQALGTEEVKERYEALNAKYQRKYK
jgi:predicted transposase/invertase (TIGR01784 family)